MKQKAVALSYSPLSGQKAPKVIASGQGLLAEQICLIAQKHEIEFIADPLLVDSLVNVPVGADIPRELYDSVAVIFRYLLSAGK